MDRWEIKLSSGWFIASFLLLLDTLVLDYIKTPVFMTAGWKHCCYYKTHPQTRAVCQIYCLNDSGWDPSGLHWWDLRNNITAIPYFFISATDATSSSVIPSQFNLSTVTVREQISVSSYRSFSFVTVISERHAFVVVVIL